MQRRTLPLTAIRLVFVLALVVATSSCSRAARTAAHLERAENYFKEGEYQKAKLEYMNVLGKEQVHPQAIRRLGQIWLEQGAPLRAAAFLFRSRELDPNDTEIRLLLAQAYERVGDRTQAFNEAATILQQQPGHAEALMLLGRASTAPEEIGQVEQALAAFPQKESPAFFTAQGTVALKKNDAGAAENAISQALAADPNFAHAHILRGVLQLARNDRQAARQSFKNAAEITPSRSPFKTAYAEFLNQIGLADDAVQYLNDVVAKAPDFLAAANLLGRIHLGQKNYEAALERINATLGFDPENIDALLLQAEVWLAQGDLKKAVEQLEKLNQAYPNLPPIRFALAGAYLKNDNLAKAEPLLNEIVAANPNQTQAILLLAEVNLRTGKAPIAIGALEPLYRQRPNIERIWRLLAAAYQATGRLDDAVNVLREQTNRQPDSAEAHLLLGVVLRQQRKTDEARPAFEKAAELAPKELLPIRHLMELDIAAERYDEAKKRAENLRQKLPGSPMPDYLLATVYHAQKQWDQAEQTLRSVLKTDPNYQAAYQGLVSVYAASGRLAEALKELDGFLEKQPNNIVANLTAARVATELKEHGRAAKYYEKLLTLTPNDVVPLNNLAYLYAEDLNQLDRAYELANKARAVSGSNPYVAGTLGWIHYKRGEYPPALTLLQEAAPRLPNEPETHYHLGMAYYMMGQAEPARASLEQALAIGKDFQGKAEAERRLALLTQTSAPDARPLGTTELEAMLKDQPRDVVVLTRLGSEWEKQNNVEKAAEAFGKAFEINPKLADVAMKLAQLNAGPLNNPAKALEFAKKARELAPADASIAGELGRIALRAGNASWASSLLQESTRSGGRNHLLYDLALAAYATGKVPEARQAMERFLAAHPSGAEAERAKTFLAFTAATTSTDIGTLEGQARDALKTEPDYLPALMLIAAAHRSRNELDQAAEIYSKVLAQNREFAPAQKELASIYGSRPNQLDKAYELANQARKLFPDDPSLLRLLGELSYKRKDYRSAVQFLQQSARKEELAPESLFYLGMAQLQTNQKTQGTENLKRAVQGNLDPALAAEAKKTLDEDAGAQGPR